MKVKIYMSAFSMLSILIINLLLSYRSELDKLLEAGLSSFHCETARQAADRLGPLKVDVSDNSSESGSTNSAEQINQTNNTNSRLLQEAAASGSDVNQNNSSKQQQNRKPKKLAKKIRAKASPGM